MSAGRRMLHSDAFAWYMEKDPVLRSTVVAIIQMDGSPDWDRLRRRIDRLSRVVPVLRMRVQEPPMRIGPPRWTLDERFDLDYHLRRTRVTAAGGWPDVLEFARTAAMADFDRARPLWEFTLLEGLRDGSAALVAKLHHSLTDGIGGIQLAGLVVDSGPESRPLGPLPAEPQGHSMSTFALATDSLGDGALEAAGNVRRIMRAAPTGVLRTVRHPLQRTKDVVTATVSIGRIVAPINRQASAVLGRRRIGRTLATMDVSLADLRTAAAIGGGHLNDAYLAALTAGVQRYHERRGSPMDTLRVTVPVSVRTDDDTIGGNRITLIRITLPAAIADPAERIREIARIMRQWRHEPALGYTQEIAFGLNLLPRPYLGSIFKRVELLASDVPGITKPVWLAGAKITGYYAFGPTIGSGLNVTLMSYANVCNIGINIDTGAVDDCAMMLACIREGFDEVLDLAPHSAAPKTAPKPARTA
jgi:diacylglycerol O-acyltransferase